MYILGIIIVILLIKIIANQQEIDERICEEQHKDDEIISFKGVINFIIFRFRVLFADTRYYLKNKFKGQK